MKEAIQVQPVDRLCNAGACARGFSDSASTKEYISLMIFSSINTSVGPSMLCVEIVYPGFLGLCPLLASHIGMFSGVPSTKSALNGKQQKSRQLRWCHVLKAWRRHLIGREWLLRKSLVSHRQVSWYGSSKATHWGRRSWRLSTTSACARSRDVVWGGGLWKTDLAPQQSIAHGAQHSMPSAYNQKHWNSTHQCML